MATWEHVATKTPMPWPLQIHQLSEMYHCPPFPGSVFDQPPDMLAAIRVCLSTARTASKEKQSDYDKVDWSIKRIVDIAKMNTWDNVESYRRKLYQICGQTVFDADGRLNFQLFVDQGIELVLPDVLRKLAVLDG